MDRIKELCLEWTNQTLWPKSYPNQTNCHLVAGLYPSEIMKFADDTKKYLCSSKLSIYQMLVKYSNCSLSFKVSKEPYPGKYVNNTWSGILKMLDNKEVDLLAHLFSFGFNRDLVIEFSTLLPQKEAVSILSYPKLIHNNDPFTILKAFTLQIWLLILLASIIYGTIYAFGVCCLKAESFSIFHLFYGYMSILAILLGDGSTYLHRNKPKMSSIILLGWVLPAYFIRQQLSSGITAVMLSPKMFQIDTFQELSNLDENFKIFVVDQSTTYKRLVEVIPSLPEKSNLVKVVHDDMTSINTLQQLITQDCALIVNTFVGESIQIYYKQFDFHLSEQKYYSSLGFYAIRKTLEKDKQIVLNRFFKKIHTYGFDQIVDSSLKLGQLKDKGALADFEQNVTEQHLTDQVNFFIFIFFIGILIAFTIFCMEIFVYKIQRKQRKTLLSRSRQQF